MRTRTRKTRTKTSKAKTATAKKPGSLSSIARKWHRKFVSIAKKAPKWSSTKRATAAQQRRVIQQEIQKVAKFLRIKTISKIDARLKMLKAQMAKRLNVALTSSKATSTAIKRLNAKRHLIANSTQARKLLKLCKGLKIASYKNPAHTKAKKRVVKKAQAKGYKKQTATLKKEIKTLKLRNAFMRKQVAKFRKEAAHLERHYGTLSHRTPHLRVVEKDVSNIVRFSNALNNALEQKAKRRMFG